MIALFFIMRTEYMLAMKATIGTKYDCNHSSEEDQICLQSWSKKGPNMIAIMITMTT